MGEIKFKLDELKTSGHKYERELLFIPMLGIEDTAQHMTKKGGVRGSKTFASFSNNLQLGPYSNSRKADGGISFNGRALRTYLGSVIQDFDPNELAESIWAEKVLLGEELKRGDLAKMVLTEAAKSIGENLYDSIWNAVRKDKGTESKDLFNGFDTITKEEITKGEISEAKGNLYKFTEEITSVNAVDKLKEFYRSAHPALRKVPTKMYLSEDIYNAYNDDYKSTGGGLIYNKEFEKLTLEGSAGKCELVKQNNKEGSPYIHLSLKDNMMIGMDQTGKSSKECIDIGKYSSFELTIASAMFFGTQMWSIDERLLLVGELKVEGGE